MRYFLVNYVGELPAKDKAAKYSYKIGDRILHNGRTEGGQNGITEGDFLFECHAFLKKSIVEKELKKKGVINVVIRNIYEFKNKKDYDTWCN